MGEDGKASSAELIDLVARCLERMDREGAGALDVLCRAHPAHADALRLRVARLERVGLGSRAPLPRSLGRYRVLAELGRGGMGVVYLARDPDLGRAVAIKAIGAGQQWSEHGRTRFAREARAVAQLEHPHIVRIHEVGEDAGRPYFVMEYVDGTSLDAVVRTLRRLDVATEDLSAAHLSVAAFTTLDRRVGPPVELAEAGSTPGEVPRSWGRSYLEVVTRMVIDVARALDHAHRNGVVHRDVKPSNVLVRTDGRVLLFDFGLARVEDEASLTATGGFAGTAYYVSPEQAAGRPVDRRTDVWSLGATLYQLLTLRVPFPGRGTQDVLSRIAGREPVPPRRFNRAVPRDLETICLTALEKDPGRRYASAADLADDLARFLEFRPVRARPIGPLLRAARAVRRNPALTAAGVLGAVVLLGTPLGLTTALVRIREEKQGAVLAATRADRESERARLEARRVGAINAFFTEMLTAAGPFRAGRDVTVLEVLERAAAGVGDDLADDPQVEASVRAAIGRTYLALGSYDEADKHLRRAREVIEERGGPPDAVALDVWRGTAELLLRRGRAAEALPILEAALEAGSELDAGADPVELTNLRVSRAAALSSLGRQDEALELYWRVLGERRAEFGAASAEVGLAHDMLSDLYQSTSDWAAAEEHAREAAAILEGRLGPDHPLVATSKQSLAEVLGLVGREPEAEVLLREVLETTERAAGADHPTTAAVHMALASTIRTDGRFAEAEEHARRALGIWRRTHAGDHEQTASTLCELAHVVRLQRRPDEAVRLASEGLEMTRRLGLGSKRVAARCSQVLVTALLEVGDDAGALQVATDAIAALEREPSARPTDLASIHRLLALAQADTVGPDASAASLREALRLFDLAADEGTSSIADVVAALHCRFMLGDCLFENGHPDAGRVEHERLVRELEAAPDNHQVRWIEAAFLNERARRLSDDGRTDDAVRALERSVDIFERFGPRYAEYGLPAMLAIARSRVRDGDPGGAARWLEHAREAWAEARSSCGPLRGVHFDLELGNAFLELGDRERAREVWTDGIGFLGSLAVPVPGGIEALRERLDEVQAAPAGP